jgi:hypothetical protein
MKAILSSRIHHYAARVSIFLIAIALIAGMAGCSGGSTYELTIASSDGGWVALPGEGTRTYYEDTVVDLVAMPAAGYQFVEWTGHVLTIADREDATTTITMSGGYSITANFERYIPMIAAGGWHTVGVESDGTVVAVGHIENGQCDVGNWTDITQVAAGEYHTVGLDVDGNVFATGHNEYDQCEVTGWDLT